MKQSENRVHRFYLINRAMAHEYQRTQLLRSAVAAATLVFVLPAFVTLLYNLAALIFFHGRECQ